MGNHGVVGAKLRAGDINKHAKKSATFHLPSPRARALQNWPVSWRLLAVIVVALVMGLVFGVPEIRSTCGFWPAWDGAGRGGQTVAKHNAVCS